MPPTYNDRPAKHSAEDVALTVRTDGWPQRAPSTLVPPRRAGRGACREDVNSPDTTKVASGKNRPHLCDGSANRDTIPQGKTGRSPRLLKAIECGVRFRSTAPYPAASERAAFIDCKASRQDMGLAFAGGMRAALNSWREAEGGGRISV